MNILKYSTEYQQDFVNLYKMVFLQSPVYQEIFTTEEVLETLATNETYLLINSNKVLIGFICGKNYETKSINDIEATIVTADNKIYAYYIEELGVNPSEQGKGYGKLLLQYFLTTKINQGGLYFIIHTRLNNSVQILYERLGFAPIKDLEGNIRVREVSSNTIFGTKICKELYLYLKSTKVRKSSFVFLFDMQGTLYPNLKAFEEMEKNFDNNRQQNVLENIPLLSNEMVVFIQNLSSKGLLGIATGGSNQWTCAVLNQLNIVQYFTKDLLFCGNSKTKIETWQSIISNIKKNFSVDVQNTFMIGDNFNQDYELPKSLGINAFCINLTTLLIIKTKINHLMEMKNNPVLSEERLIVPKTLNGFRDILPSLAITKEDMIATIKGVFRKFGFAPIETPHLEYSEILLGKGSDEIQKQLYRFLDNGKRDVTLRFDHTVPLARFVVQHKNSLGLPFKRYAVGNVFRGESPQSGRYREFTQCDFDFIGTYNITADTEIVQVIYHALKTLKIDDFTIFINNRKIMNGLCEKINIGHKVTDVLRIVDKINKIGAAQVQAELIQEIHLSVAEATEIMNFIAIRQRDYKNDFFNFIEKYKAYNSTMKEGIEEIAFMHEILTKVGINPNNYTIDFSIARGLGYYTGIVYETTLDKLPQIGAVASGGRFDNLTKSFSKDNLPGVGASIGIDRLIAALEKLGIISSSQTPAKVLVANMDVKYIADAYTFATQLRNADIAVEVYPEVTKIAKQFAFAEKKGHEYLIAFGEKEAIEHSFVLANLKTGEKILVNSIALLVSKIKS